MSWPGTVHSVQGQHRPAPLPRRRCGTGSISRKGLSPDEPRSAESEEVGRCARRVAELKRANEILKTSAAFRAGGARPPIQARCPAAPRADRFSHRSQSCLHHESFRRVRFERCAGGICALSDLSADSVCRLTPVRCSMRRTRSQDRDGVTTCGTCRAPTG